MTKTQGFMTAGLLALCQGLFMSSGAIVVATSALVAQIIAPTPELATFPAAMMIVGTTAASIPLGFIMARYSRTIGFQIGAVAGIAGAGISAIAIYENSFWGFVVGLFFIGVFGSSAQFYRFAAGEVVPTNFKNRAMSWVLLGGILAAFVGPKLADFTRDFVITAPYLGAYLSQMGIVTLAAVLIAFMRFPSDRPKVADDTEKQSLSIMPALKRSRFWVGQSVATLGYMVMAFLMSATPLAMIACNHEFGDSAFVISSHIAAMFLPSFFTGSLVDRWGPGIVMFLGGVLIAIAAAFGLSGIDVKDFWLSLVFLGIGWNFTYVAGSIVISEEAASVNAKKLEGVSGFLLMGGVAIATTFSGTVFAAFGWTNQLILALPLAFGICLAAGWLSVREFTDKRHTSFVS